jgi:hypothetical protein
MTSSSSSVPIEAETSLWFYADANNQPVGPLTFEALRQLSAAGTISPRTQVIQQGDSSWRTFAEVVPPTSIPRSTGLPSGSEAKKHSRIIPIGGLIFVYPLGLLLLWRCNAFAKRTKAVLALAFLPFFLAVLLAPRSTPTAPVIAGQVPSREPSEPGRGSIAYKIASLDAGRNIDTSAPTVREFQSLLRDVAAKTKLTEEAVADKVWVVRKHLVSEKKLEVSALELLKAAHKVVMNTTVEDPFDSTLAAIATIMFAEAEKHRGGNLGEVASAQVLAVMKTIEQMKQGGSATPVKTFRKSDFAIVFDGQMATEIGNADVQNLGELMAGISEGKATVEDAKECVFTFDAIRGSFKNVVGDYLIYAVPGSYRRTFEFALRRDPAFEREQQKHYPDIGEFYEELRRSTLDSRDPLRQGAVIVTGTTEFTTEGGFVKHLPVVKAIQLAP